ncbi:polysaccharide deacetylase family protein [Candidatus Omnitrophota bacterium]
MKSIFSYLKKRRIKILLYHSISDNHKDPCNVQIKDFEEQMKWIVDNGYKVISLKEALESLNKDNIQERSIVLTFDDGFVDFSENALPILNKYNFKATIFIVTSQVGKMSNWRDNNLNLPLMDWKELEEIANSGCSIGSHGLYHRDLIGLTVEGLDKETSVSKQIIFDRLGIAVDSFSYPWGRCSRRELDSVRKAGYRCAVTAGGRWNNGPETDRFLLKRIAIERNDSLVSFAKKVI